MPAVTFFSLWSKAAFPSASPFLVVGYSCSSFRDFYKMIVRYINVHLLLLLLVVVVVVVIVMFKSLHLAEICTLTSTCCDA